MQVTANSQFGLGIIPPNCRHISAPGSSIDSVCHVLDFSSLIAAACGNANAAILGFTMSLTYHFSFSASAATSADELAAFLETVEGDARLMGFHPTIVVNGPFDSAERRDFSRRVARGLVVEDARLLGQQFAKETCWSVGLEAGYCRLAPEYGVLLVVTDSAGRETAFGFFRYPRVIRDSNGREIMPVRGDGAWTSGSFVCSPDQRYRAIVRRFAAAGFLASEIDEFSAAAKS